MRKIPLLLLPLLLISHAACARLLTIDEPTADFGEKYQFSRVDHDFEIWNNSDEAVVVKSLRRLVGPGEGTIGEQRIAPHRSTRLHLDVALTRSIGRTSTRFMLETEESGKVERYVVRLSGYVLSILNEPSPQVDLGIVPASGSQREQTVRLASDDIPQLKISKILDAPPFARARVAPDRRSVIVKSARTSILGINVGLIKVALDSTVQPEAWIQVFADVRGRVVPEENPLDFGLQRSGHRTPLLLQLTSRDGRDFKIGKYEAVEAKVSIEPTPCLPKPAPGCRAFMIALGDDQPLGQVSGKLTFSLPESGQQLTVNLGGLLLDDATAVKPLESLVAHDASQSEETRGVSVVAELKKLADGTAPTEVPPPGEGPLLKWQVANESGVYGYGIYRSDTAAGHFTRINSTLIKARNFGDNTSAAYQWRDTSAVAGREYWYYIVVFHASGRKEPLSGPQKVVAR